MAVNVFEVQGLAFAYGSQAQVFDDLNLEIREGCITTIIGANGCGKSTLFNLLTKNLKPGKGRVLLRGVDIADLRLRDFSRLVSIVHQQNIAPADLTVERLVEYGRYAHRGAVRLGSRRSGLPEGARKGGSQSRSTLFAQRQEADLQAVELALSLTDTSNLAKLPIASLSSGQRQRVWIAMALAQEAKVLLLDEPTTYLDVRYQLEILDLVKFLQEQLCMTVVMVLHDINHALYYSDEVVALANGKVVAQGLPEDIVSPQLIKDVYGIGLDVIDLEGRPFVLNVERSSGPS